MALPDRHIFAAPKGRPEIARGGAQRNPWSGGTREYGSPEGATLRQPGSPLRGYDEIAAGFQGLRSLSLAPPLAITGRPFGATQRRSRCCPAAAGSLSPRAMNTLLALVAAGLS